MITPTVKAFHFNEELCLQTPTWFVFTFWLALVTESPLINLSVQKQWLKDRKWGWLSNGQTDIICMLVWHYTCYLYYTHELKLPFYTLHFSGFCILVHSIILIKDLPAKEVNLFHPQILQLADDNWLPQKVPSLVFHPHQSTIALTCKFMSTKEYKQQGGHACCHKRQHTQKKKWRRDCYHTTLYLVSNYQKCIWMH